VFEKHTDPRQVLLFPGRMPVSHRYTAGLAGERFFRALQERAVFLATRCDACGVTYCPTRAFCERCLGALDHELEAGPAGTLESFTVVHVGLDSERLDPPVVIGLVRLDGADTPLVHRLGGSGGEPLDQSGRGALHIGMRVEAIFEDRPNRRAHLNDVRCFRPLP
jgi:uncharacterized OB-fold protein